MAARACGRLQINRSPPCQEHVCYTLSFPCDTKACPPHRKAGSPPLRALNTAMASEVIIDSRAPAQSMIWTHMPPGIGWGAATCSSHNSCVWSGMTNRVDCDVKTRVRHASAVPPMSTGRMVRRRRLGSQKNGSLGSPPNHPLTPASQITHPRSPIPDHPQIAHLVLVLVYEGQVLLQV
jgi:hypothetical protein